MLRRDRNVCSDAFAVGKQTGQKSLSSVVGCGLNSLEADLPKARKGSKAAVETPRS
jgi:hypothetical protein